MHAKADLRLCADLAQPAIVLLPCQPQQVHPALGLHAGAEPAAAPSRQPSGGPPAGVMSAPTTPMTSAGAQDSAGAALAQRTHLIAARDREDDSSGSRLQRSASATSSMPPPLQQPLSRRSSRAEQRGMLPPRSPRAGQPPGEPATSATGLTLQSQSSRRQSRTSQAGGPPMTDTVGGGSLRRL